MRVPPEVAREISEGALLSPDDAAALEHDLQQRPDDIDARARLLGYYEASGKKAFEAATMQEMISLSLPKAPHRAALAQHAVWLAANAPHVPLAAHPLLQLSTGDSGYAELSSIWRRQVGADRADSDVLANAIAFFWWPNYIFADEVLARAEELFPDDRRWLVSAAQARAGTRSCLSLSAVARPRARPWRRSERARG